MVNVTFIHLADAFIQSDLQLRNTISDKLKRGKQNKTCCNTTFQALFRAKLARKGEVTERAKVVFLFFYDEEGAEVK